uniref:Movement protein TGB2 n=1 Tax=Daphne virus S TaxID=216614 RepID=A0A0U5APV6_9VIRU|nr:triple gene block protein 2 [Daphne virus S]
MPLTPPPDYTTAVLVAAATLGATLFISSLTRNTQPQVGDNIHSLPHGGYYKDGTKVVHYGAPGKFNSVEFTRDCYFQPWFIIVLLTFLIILSSRHRGHTCTACR